MNIEKTLCGTKFKSTLRIGTLMSALALVSFLAGCAGPTSTTTSTTASTTSAAAIPTVSPTFQKEFIGWAEACQAYSLGAYAATTAIAGNKIKTSAFPTIRNIIATTTPLCHTFPTSPQQTDIAITEATAALAESMQSNQITAPTAAPSSYQTNMSKSPTLSYLMKGVTK